MAVDMKALICSQCGASDVTVITDTLGRCNCCGTQFAIQSRQQASQRVVVAHPAGEGQRDIRFFTLKSAWDSLSFVRQALIELYADENIPVNIHEAEFLPAVTEYPQFAIFTADYTIDYSAEIGYYRTETYTTFQTVHEHGRAHSKPVTATRNFTEWQCYTRTEHFNDRLTLAAVSLPDKSALDPGFERNELRILAGILSNHGREKLEEYNGGESLFTIVPPNREHVRRGMNLEADRLAERCRQSLPGNTNRNFSFSYRGTPKDVDWLVAPEYTLPFRFEGYPYEMRSFISERQVRKIAVPTHSIKQEVEAESKNSRFKSLWLPTIIGAVLFLMAFLFDAPPGLFLMLFALTGAYALTAYLIWHHRINQETHRRKSERQSYKKDCLGMRLYHLGLQPLTAEELSRYFPPGSAP